MDLGVSSDVQFCERLHGNNYIQQFSRYLDTIISHRKGTPLRPSSKATYRSSITMILSTYMYYRTEDDFFNGHLDDILQLERKYDNNANYSMQNCAISHFKDFILSRNKQDWIKQIRKKQYCPTCLCGCDVCHKDGICGGVTECFGKCNKLYSRCRLEESKAIPNVEEGVCVYCLRKYSPLFQVPTDSNDAKRRARYIEYMNDHALVGRSASAKYGKLIRSEILKNVRWHSMQAHACDHPLCHGYSRSAAGPQQV